MTRSIATGCGLAAAMWAPTALADTVTLQTGETLVGTVVEQTEQAVVLEHPVLGPLMIPAEQVSAVTVGDAAPTEAPADAPAPAEAAVQAEPEAPPAAPTPAPPPTGFRKLLAEWDNSISLGVSGSQGNTDDVSLRAQFQSRKETETDRWTVDLRYYFEQEEGDTSDNNFIGDLVKDWLFQDSPWLLFAKGRYEYDQFEQWKHRVSGFGGVGYTWFKQEDFEFNTRLGGGVTREFSGQEETRPEALIAAELVIWKPTEAQSVTASTTLFPDLGDFAEFRWVTTAEWRIAINQADGMSVRLGIENEYESEVASGSEHNDLKYYGALSLDF